ncbi:hypothetical protein O181_021380 [Austropuccinia psidii MF-1]|uniref:amidase n=1 Tax=Austropuccinia psidii MF-1 TaxID=1389203 RepID=A0A9Q3CFM8_9BASI|nr:hypothetical protein [Austropuccinia psidii MF-1]
MAPAPPRSLGGDMILSKNWPNVVQDEGHVLLRRRSSKASKQLKFPVYPNYSFADEAHSHGQTADSLLKFSARCLLLSRCIPLETPSLLPSGGRPVASLFERDSTQADNQIQELFVFIKKEGRLRMLSHFFKFLMGPIDPRSHWNTKTSIKRQERLNKLVETINIDPIEPSLNYFNAFEVTILSTPANEIVNRIKSKRLNWSCKNVVKAFIKSAIHAHIQTNCLTEIMFEEALERAEKLDKEFLETGKIKGRLHGIPISLKDQFNVKGYDSTIGFTQYIHQPAQTNAWIVDRLLEEGAIILAKTNVPQSLFSFECSNPIFGPTHNPHKHGYTSGGSSGGEAALLASDGTCLGIGTDVGGSLRIPAHYSGCYSLKPCDGRIVSYGLRRANKGYTEISSTIGPMARSWEDLVLLSQVMFDRPDPVVGRKFGLIPLDHFRNDVFEQTLEETGSSPLKFGYFTTDHIIEASAPCQRAVKEVVQVLGSNGYQCIEIDVNRLKILEGLILFVGLSSADGYETILSQVGSEPLDRSLFLTTLGAKLPNWFKWIACLILKNLWNDGTMASLLAASGVKSTKELQEWRVRKDAYCLMVRSYLWEELKLDALICPTQAVPAIPIGSSWNKSFLAESTFLWNLVDSTVGQIPITRVTREKDQLSMKRSETQAGLVNNLTKDLLNFNSIEGLPIGIQVVCGVWEEEKVLGIMGLIEKNWNNIPSFTNEKETATDKCTKIDTYERLVKSGDFISKRRYW